MCIQLGLDLYLACCAWVFFEFLINKGIVSKKNKDLYLSVVFLLTMKFYDIDDKKYIVNFFELCSKIFDEKVKKKDILENEMKVFANLNFTLIAPFDVVKKHMDYVFKRDVKNKIK